MARFEIRHVIGHRNPGGGWGFECTFRNYGGGPAEKVRFLYLQEGSTEFPQSGAIDGVPPGGEFKKMLDLPGSQPLGAFRVRLEVTDEFGTREELVPWVPGNQ